ncbi:hypothetical protein O1611_g4523 [Lasiodiplodia mahajangana]|uniref:Uncharacterized protein n=1 Tax=Lasiodiplodia mahajangana TaxID=1108764 RepID=A0ACC2JNN6_9PEZI|nr:hypothetical protein O1611_g4523 [Lasiodiplodia mahajangana]
MGVSTLTLALSLFVSDTYPLRDVLDTVAAVNLGKDWDCRKGVTVKDCLRPRRDARLKAVVATLAMIVEAQGDVLEGGGIIEERRRAMKSWAGG